ncbi:MAG: STAS/SEC14 domain-containing protein [Povalibacter sp.]
MPFTYSIDLPNNLIRQQLWGRITTVDLREIASMMWRDPQYRKKLHILADMRDAQADVSYEEMLEYTHFLSGKSDIGRQAIVVSRQLEFGMARMYQQVTEHNVLRADLRVFLDMKAAEEWILSKPDQRSEPSEQDS